MLTHWQKNKDVRQNLVSKVERQNKYDKIGSLQAVNVSILKPVVTSRDESVSTKQTESQIDYDVFHFKVMELKTIEDG